MISTKDESCPKCGGKLKYYDSVLRLIRRKYGEKRYVRIRRMKCKKCNSVHRELPRFLFPHKHYEADIIKGVLERLITVDTLGYEDYPCEMTIHRWLTFAKIQNYLIEKAQ